MSGGHFDYKDNHISDIAYSVEDVVEHNYNGYTSDTIEEFKKGVHFLKLASIYAHRIDWLPSSDDGEDSFHIRLKEDLDDLEDMEYLKKEGVDF